MADTLDHGLFKQMQMAHLRMLCLADVWPGHSWSVVAVERCAGRPGSHVDNFRGTVMDLVIETKHTCANSDTLERCEELVMSQ